ncbi:type II secretion system protein GspK [Candidatus Halobeggiatoa sp. HSG11]|nr:type II secretion system protein GspK [Candidatus Halobeggiatoa sp. HSG11]
MKINNKFLKHQNGFVLVTTLWILAALTIAASYFALWTQKSVNIVQDMQADTQGEIDMYSTQTSITYLLITQKLNVAGLTVPKIDDNIEEIEEIEVDEISSDSILPVGGEIKLDDRPYVGYGKAFFALQDKRGLIGINFADKNVISSLLGVLGVEPELRGPLVAKLQDYIDFDDLHRLNGAEDSHYKRLNLPPPINNYLTTSMECKNILDWSEQETLWKNNAFGQLTNTMFATYPNFNTAPALVLQAAYNLTTEHAQRIVATRKNSPVLSIDQLNQMTGTMVDVDPEELMIFPSTNLRLTIWYEGSKRMRQVHINLPLSLISDKKPWEIDYYLDIPLLPIYTEIPPIHAQTTFFDSTLSPKMQ